MLAAYVDLSHTLRNLLPVRLSGAMTKKTKCMQCGGKMGHGSCRGCCFTCYQRVRRAVISGSLSIDEAVRRKLIKPRGKPGARGMYAGR